MRPYIAERAVAVFRSAAACCRFQLPQLAAAFDRGGREQAPASPKRQQAAALRKAAAITAALQIVFLLLASCAAPEKTKPSILLITLDTTRADAIRPDVTPSIDAFAKRGMSFRYAYATVPQTLPSHASMLTGLYPAAHGVHENSRYLADTQPLVAEKLQATGYRTAAFVSSFVLAKRFGIARGFETYDDELGSREERSAKETTDRALRYLSSQSGPTFIWVHYYDPHFPYTGGYLAEVKSMDEQVGRLIRAFEERAKDGAVIIASDHGEGLGDHGEQQHGDLLYQSTMHVPLIIAGPGVKPGTSDAAVSTRRIAHTVLDWAGLDATASLRGELNEVVAGEAMKPFLSYGWQPQVMAVDGRQKVISAGRLEVYDVVADPGEARDLSARGDITRAIRATLRDYPIVPPPQAGTQDNLDEESRKKLASLGYVASTVKPRIRADAPRPADMTSLFPVLEEAAQLFVAGDYAKAIPLLERILASDPYNLEAALRLATAHSSLGHDAQAVAAFERAQRINPDSIDVRTYLALHYARGKEWPKAVPLLERIRVEDPKRLPPLEALAVIREREQRIAEAVQLRKEIYTMRIASTAELRQLGRMQMSLGQTVDAIATFEDLRSRDAGAFDNHLELGVLYLAVNRLGDARVALDRVQPGHPDYAMALFKRAQVSVLLKEQDAPSRIEMARRHATPLTRELIARERLFRNPQN